MPYELLQDPLSHGSNKGTIWEKSLLTTWDATGMDLSGACPDLLKALLKVAVIPLQMYSESN